jgi:hypothetical protein
MMKDFAFRWYDPVGNKWAEFTANSEEEFCEAAINASIDYRLASGKPVGRTYHYPTAHLEVRYGGSTHCWQCMRLAWNCPPMQLKRLGSQIKDDSGRHKSDITRIRTLSHVWWDSIQRWSTSFLHHLTVDPNSYRHWTMVAPD